MISSHKFQHFSVLYGISSSEVQSACVVHEDGSICSGSDPHIMCDWTFNWNGAVYAPIYTALMGSY